MCWEQKLPYKGSKNKIKNTLAYACWGIMVQPLIIQTAFRWYILSFNVSLHLRPELWTSGLCFPGSNVKSALVAFGGALALSCEEVNQTMWLESAWFGQANSSVCRDPFLINVTDSVRLWVAYFCLIDRRYLNWLWHILDELLYLAVSYHCHR